MRKTVFLATVIALLVGLSCAAMAAGPLPYEVDSNGSTLSIDRHDVGSGIWEWDFTVENNTESDIIDFFHVGFGTTAFTGGLASHIVSGSLYASNGATGLVGDQTITWMLGDNTLNPGGTANFSFRTDLGGITLATHDVTDDGYSANWEYAPTPAPVPEPGTMAILATGLTGLVGFMVRKRK